ncbi:hypothetical protein D3C81_1694170 [compost metagenome]
MALYAITSTSASASKDAAASSVSVSDSPRLFSPSRILVSLNRVKWTETSLKEAAIAAVTGSTTVFDDGVSIPIFFMIDLLLLVYLM